MTQKRKTIHLDFEKGVYQDLTKNLIPFEHGIYLAYTGNFNGKMCLLINYFILVWQMTRQ